MEKNSSLIIGVIVIVAVAGLVFWQIGDKAPVASPQTPATETGSAQNTTGATYTMSDVATHKDASSCWTAIDGSVYDLTQWISQHPGGPEAIESICGIDGSAAFHNQHDHAARQGNILATFKIGTLSQ
jgi:cytochrome b involved in lipid metabolism